MRSEIPAFALPRIADGRLLRERAYDALRDAIVRLELVPGQALTERVLSERLGVSKSPIRDALIHLEREGLVRSSPFKGFEVAPITEAECREVFQVREALEVFCVDHFARGHDAAALAALEETHRELARHGIRANCVSIALVQTESLGAHTGGGDGERMQRILAQDPLRRLGRAEDVTPMVLLLASPLSSWTTGQVVSVNGGYAMV